MEGLECGTSFDLYLLLQAVNIAECACVAWAFRAPVRAHMKFDTSSLVVMRCPSASSSTTSVNVPPISTASLA